MIRTLGGVAAGIAIAIVTMMVIEGIGHQLFPPPRLDLQNPNTPAAMPFANLIVPVIAWFFATLAGGWIAAWLSRQQWTAWIIAAAVLVGELLDFLLGRHPAWMMAVGLLAPLAAAWIVRKLPARERASA